MKEINKKDMQKKLEYENGRLVFNTEEDAHDYFIETEGTESDDVDKEEARFERWFNEYNCKIKE